MKVRCPSKFYMRPDHGVHRVPRSRHGLGVSTGSSGFSPSAVRRNLRLGFILPRAFRLLQSATACCLPPGTLRHRRAPPMEFLPSSRHQLAASTNTRRSHSPSYGPSSTFRTSSTVCSATNLAGLFHPATTSRVCPSGVCPSPRSRTGLPRPSHALLPLSAPACDQPARPRLQGFAPHSECGIGETG